MNRDAMNQMVLDANLSVRELRREFKEQFEETDPEPVMLEDLEVPEETDGTGY